MHDTTSNSLRPHTIPAAFTITKAANQVVSSDYFFLFHLTVFPIGPGDVALEDIY
jgi:hypothetical protein